MSNQDKLNLALDYSEAIIKRLMEEIEATKNLLAEGDPFLMNRRDYLDNLFMIAGFNTRNKINNA